MEDGNEAAASSDPREESAEPAAINVGDDGDEGDFGDEGDLGDDGGDADDGGDFGDEAEITEFVEDIEEDAIAQFVETELVTEIITESAAEIIFELVLTLVFLISEVDDPAWINDPARRNTMIEELRPAVEDFSSRGVAPSADDLRILRDRIRARWRQ